ncbi:MAG TPA: DUF4388 domain-containing protein [Thermoanaerobaculia bacterium]|nr:DUF4388 domain-containing protein [Thermoanaerobaculia bacterium]
MAFQGSLKELPLPDIIQLVSVSGKTGKFTLVRDSERGFIYLKNGQMVHAEVGDLAGEEAVYTLAIWSSGDFQFTAGEEPQKQTITKSNTNLLMEAARRLDEWRVLSKKIPSVLHVPELKPRENRHEQVTLDPQQWLIVTKIDGQRSIQQIGRLLELSPFDVAKVLYGMIGAELVDLKKKKLSPTARGAPPTCSTWPAASAFSRSITSASREKNRSISSMASRSAESKVVKGPPRFAAWFRRSKRRHRSSAA